MSIGGAGKFTIPTRPHALNAFIGLQTQESTNQASQSAYDQVDKCILQVYLGPMSIHSEVLQAANRICRERGGWSFRPDEIVRALPNLNANSVRTHIVSRCCVNAPRNHPHKWEYFRRIGRGIYEILPSARQQPAELRPLVVGESAPSYATRTRRDSVHAVIERGERAYVAECLEVAVVTQGKTLDEVVSNLHEALALHVAGEDMAAFGLVNSPRLVLTYESRLDHGAATSAAVR